MTEKDIKRLAYSWTTFLDFQIFIFSGQFFIKSSKPLYNGKLAQNWHNSFNENKFINIKFSDWTSWSWAI